MQAAKFHKLTVASVDTVTDESVRVTFDVPQRLEATFAHIPGQHVIVRATIGGETVRRSYSICSRAGSRSLQVGIKHLRGGVFSSFANTELEAGDVIEVTPPTGEFTVTTDPGNKRHYVAIVAGSGITPVLSMIESVLADEPESRFTLVYGNKDGRSVMFLDDLDRLKNHHPGRFVLFNILSRESNVIPVFEGRLDEGKLVQLLTTVVDAASATDWYLCGPAGVVEAARSVLARGGVPPDKIRDELFYAGGDAPPRVAVDDEVGSTVKVTIDGRTSKLVVDPEGAPILDHVLAIRPEAPFSCRSGACASCRAQVTTGEVRMDRNWALEESEVAAGQILTCQSHPVSDIVELTYDV
ncbi:MAG: 2Fe-2S iron-sulfur cluster-binding protein [Acidimicrobiia bacterium]